MTAFISQPQTRSKKTDDRINPNKFLCLTWAHIFDSIFRFISSHSFDVLLYLFIDIVAKCIETNEEERKYTQMSKCLFPFFFLAATIWLLLFLIRVYCSLCSYCWCCAAALLLNRPRDQFRMSTLNSFLVFVLYFFLFVFICTRRPSVSLSHRSEAFVRIRKVFFSPPVLFKSDRITVDGTENEKETSERKEGRKNNRPCDWVTGENENERLKRLREWTVPAYIQLTF